MKQKDFGGGVWESNPTCRNYRYGTAVLKTAPVTGQDAPPRNEGAQPSIECGIQPNGSQPVR